MDEALAWYAGITRVTRREAIAVPAIKRARDLIVTPGRLQLRLYGPDNKPTDWAFLAQPEDATPGATTWTNVFDDMLFSERSWLRITHWGWHGKPVQAVRLNPETVTARPQTRNHVTVSGSGTSEDWIADALLIRIDSPNDGILTAGARAIRTLRRLEAAALAAAEGVPPQDYFTAADGVAVDPFEDDEEAAQFLEDWAKARQKRATAYVPAGLKYQVSGWNPEQLQLVQAREMAITEIARLTGVDAEELGVSTTSRTYFNAQDRRRAFLDFTVGPYMRAVEARLSMDDVTPRGYTVRFDTSDFTRADDLTAAQTDETLIRSGVLEVNEARARRGLAPRSAPAPTPVPQEATR